MRGYEKQASSTKEELWKMAALIKEKDSTINELESRLNEVIMTQTLQRSKDLQRQMSTPAFAETRIKKKNNRNKSADVLASNNHDQSLQRTNSHFNQK